MNQKSSCVLIALLLMFIGAITPAISAHAPVLQLNIGAQPLGDSLRELAAVSNTNIAFDPLLVSGMQAPALNGALTTQEALKRLLVGTKLQARFVDDKTVTVIPEESKTARAPVSLNTSSGSPPPSSRAAEGGGEVFRLTQAAPSNSSSSVSASDDAEKNAVEEIIVTAQKRAELLKNVPISISVISGEELDSSTAQGVTEALNRVPGVSTSVQMQSGGTFIGVRGVTNNGALFGGSSPVAYYLDSVPFGLVRTPLAPDSSAYDLARVEVLRGPQGSLYGASALNGVVRVLTKDANLDKYEFKARTSVSSTKEGGESYRGDMAFNVPIVEGKLAARAVVGYQDADGWIDRPNDENANDAQIRNLRLKVNAQPTDDFSIALSAWSSRSDYGAPSYGDDNAQHSSVRDDSYSTDYDAYGLGLNYDLPLFSISSQTSYLEYENTGSIDFAPAFFNDSLATAIDAEVFSEEVVLSSNSESSWKWSLGGFYRDAEDQLRQRFVLAGGASHVANKSQSYAAFGQIGRRFLGDKLEWALGLRYFHDDVTAREVSSSVVGQPLASNAFSFSSTTPRAVLTWYPNAGLTMYGSYSEGFRSGFGQSPSLTRAHPNIPPVKPDKLHNYEIGAKSEVLGGLISFDAAVYYIDWKDIQQSLQVPYNGATVTAVVNGVAASGPGFEFSAAAYPRDGLELGVNFGWNDLKMDDVTLVFPSITSTGVILFDKGDRLNLSPEYTAGAHASYDFPLGGSGLQGRIGASADYTTPQDFRAVSGTSRRLGSGDTIFTSGATFSVRSQEGWTATLFVDNANNEKGKVRREPNPAITVFDYRIRPRTVGLQFEYKY